MPDREGTQNPEGPRQVPIRPAMSAPASLPGYPPPPFPPLATVATPYPLASYPPPAYPATPAPGQTWGYAAGTWAPRADVYRENGDYIIITDIPGIDLDTLDLTWDGGELVLEADIRPADRPDRQPLLRERPSGSYYRRIPLEPDLDPTEPVASYCDGILEVRVPRKRHRPRRRTGTVRVKRSSS